MSGYVGHHWMVKIKGEVKLVEMSIIGFTDRCIHFIEGSYLEDDVELIEPADSSVYDRPVESKGQPVIYPSAGETWSFMAGPERFVGNLIKDDDETLAFEVGGTVYEFDRIEVTFLERQ